MEQFHKTLRLGTVEMPPRSSRAQMFGGRHMSIYVKVEYSADGKLSLSGVEGPLPSGNCLGSCGQINMDGLNIENYAPGWNSGMVAKLTKLWDRWHLNNMRAGCEHQRGEGWEREQVQIVTYRLQSAILRQQNVLKRDNEERLASGETVTPTEDDMILLSLPFEGTAPVGFELPFPELYNVQNTETKWTNGLKPSEHPKGILTKACPECGYKYGSAWNKETVPDEVLNWLHSLPDTDRTPAWV